LLCVSDLGLRNLATLVREIRRGITRDLSPGSKPWEKKAILFVLVIGIERREERALISVFAEFLQGK